MSSNRRGTYNEKFIAQRLPGGRKVSERGKKGHDVESLPMRLINSIWKWEAKYLAELPKWLKAWQAQALEQETPVIFRENRGDLWVMLPLDWFTAESDLADVTDLMQLTAEEVSEIRAGVMDLYEKVVGSSNLDEQ